MNRNLSIYLDFMRLAAAAGVVVGHSRHSIFPSIPSVFAHTSECVAVFFVLSGFVISYVAKEKEFNWRDYVVARSSRMYSVVIVAIVAGIILDSVGNLINNSLYQSLEYYNGGWSYLDILHLLTFTNELWLSHVYIGTNEPYWSLGFEVIYYIIFGIIVFMKGYRRVIFLLVAAIIAGPKILSYFPLWMIGGLTYYLTCISGIKLSKVMAAVVFIASILFYGVVKYISQGAENIYHYENFAQVSKSIVYFHVVGICVSANIVAFNSFVDEYDIFPKSIANGIRWLAGGSFTLYLAHQPIMTLLQALFPHIRQSAILGAVGLLAVLLAALLLAEAGERRKAAFTKVFRGVFGQR